MSQRYYASGLVASDGSVLQAPAADGSAGQVIQTDGAGNLSFVDAPSGGGGIDGGTAAAPGLAVVGDSNTGLFADSADQLAVSGGRAGPD